MKTNKFVTNTVVAITSTSVVLSSCSGYFNDCDFIEETQLQDIGENAIEISLSNEDSDYLDMLNKLGNDILREPEIAKDFSKNPSKFLSKYGYEGDVDLDENMMRMVLALGDEQINAAIKNNDVGLAVKLMEEKGLLYNTFTNLSLTDEQINRINELMKIDGENTRAGQYLSRTQAVLLVVTVVYAVAAIVSQAAVAYNVALAVNALAGVNAVAGFNAVYSTNVKVSSLTRLNQMSNVVENNYVLKILDLKGITDGTYIAANEYINNQVQEFMQFIKDEYPQILDKVPENELSNYLRAIFIQ